MKAKRSKVIPGELAQLNKEIADRKWAQSLTDESLIDWVAALACEGKQDWGCLRREILRRIDNAAAQEPKARHEAPSDGVIVAEIDRVIAHRAKPHKEDGQ